MDGLRDRLFEQCMKCSHLITRTSMRTGIRTYACDNGVSMMACFGGIRYVGKDGVILPDRNCEAVCESFMERFIALANQEESVSDGRD